MIFFDYENSLEVRGDFDLVFGRCLPPLDGRPLHIATGNYENAVMILQGIANVIINQYNIIDNIYMSTYNINQDACSVLEQLCYGHISGTVNVLFNSGVERMAPEKNKLIIETLSSVPDVMFYSTSNNHSKIQLISGGGNYFIVEGSGNLAKNSNNEQYTIFNSFELFCFRRDIIMGQFSDAALCNSINETNSLSNKMSHIGI